MAPRETVNFFPLESPNISVGTLRFSVNNITSFPRDHSLSVSKCLMLADNTSDLLFKDLERFCFSFADNNHVCLLIILK